jgi:hypothetical protein
MISLPLNLDLKDANYGAATLSYLHCAESVINKKNNFLIRGLRLS